MLPERAGDVVALPVPAEEQAGLLRAEGEQPGVRAGQPFLAWRVALEQVPQAGRLGLPTRLVREVEPHPEIQVERELVRLEQHRDQPRGIPP